jgi:hypothetical protein
MIDNFALALTHALLLLAAWRLLRRPDLDDADAAPPAPAQAKAPRAFGKRPGGKAAGGA